MSRSTSPAPTALISTRTCTASGPTFSVTAIDRATRQVPLPRRAERAHGHGLRVPQPKAADKIAGPAGTGLIGYKNSYDMLEDAALAAKQAKEKLTAKSVTAGKYDLVLDPNHLGLTIHESVGHPTGARPRAGLRGQLRRHQLRHARLEGQGPALRLEAGEHCGRQAASQIRWARWATTTKA